MMLLRELLGEAPMLLAPQINVREVIGNGRFGAIHKATVAEGDSNVELILHVTSCPADI